MNRMLFQTVTVLALFVCANAIAQDSKLASLASLFEPPVRLKVNNEFIDTGSAWGHSSPCIADVDGDGLDDLIVGDFGGKFQVYRNTNTNKAPAYVKEGLIQAGGVNAEVHIYCCIGAQARFCDLDGDGTRDMIANSYDPGHCYLFRGLADHKFAAREELVDKSKTPIRSAPVQKQFYQSFGSFFEAVDWDNDGDFDLLIGCFDGGLKVRLNDGTAKKPEFAVNNIVVESSGQPLKVKAHCCPVVADWDGDGRWDIIAGSDDGSVTWFRNTGTKSSPAFASGHELVAPNDGSGYNLLHWNDQDIVPGIRSQVEVTDYNRDGKLDLLVGDFYTAYDFRADLSVTQK
ncbi:MAG: VCBS repeat-containing protein, partial [Pirellula sp.]